ncbi:hypothetical protein SAMN05444397_110175 [Flavobacterium aquidurense]|uniref:Collagen triple helix repeat-containing protein n=1 Tax=Flavobacterium frigidimaris TaxID=262320 RepID=A0ABX4BNG1_FLAFR|nr:hypothetical protein [Flavobacterium frigidimaris]OXA78018.1 hypothetical protein B0A65_14755 [Flavobacterium frigidimaris]SDZ62020.1 hypothetical protein SAMN05444397_110175 [Flavobacterium aquidurense]
MKILKTILTLFSIVVFTASCSSDDGVDGTNGVDGQQGAPGATGTANVIYSAWLTAPTAVAETVDGTSGMSTTINAPELSEDILAKGTILVYVSFGSGTFTLPYTSTAGGFVNTITAISTAKKIKLFRFRHDGGGTVNLPTSLSWRYVLIPGGVAAATAKTAKLDYAKMSYEEVCAHFNIQP